MSFYQFKQIPISINNNQLIINDAELSQNITLDSPYKNDEVVNDRYLPKSNYGGGLKIKYYLTGQDFLKQYIYSQENQKLSGSLGGISFNQGYLTNYSINCSPNTPIEVSVDIEFFDKLSGTFVTAAPQNLTGTILNFYNVSINTLPTYTTNVLNNISQINFNYSCQVTPSYEAVDTGSPPVNATRVNIGERKITTEVISDNVNMNLPLSGEKFGINLTFINPYNTELRETFGCSGMISSKVLSIQANNIHSHQIRIEQSHLNNFGNIGSVTVVPALNLFSVYSEAGYHSFTSLDNSLNYIKNIYVGDTLCPDYSYTDAFGSNFLLVNIPPNIVDDTLTVQTTRGNLVWPNILNFTYSGIGISGLSMYSGYAGTSVNITGSNFYRISDIYYGSAKAAFKTISPTLIQSIVPYDGITSKIRVVSARRNISGTSTGVFFCRPSITTVTPVTGLWKDILTIGGLNFSGTTGVKFNGINAFSYSILSNSIITARTPETGAGFPSGYITVYGSGGSAQSIPRYNPQVPIYSYDPISGVFYDNINIRTKIDTGYLFPFSGGYKVKFGNVDTIFSPSGRGSGVAQTYDYTTSPYSTGNRSGIMDIFTSFTINGSSSPNGFSGLINGAFANYIWLQGSQQINRGYVVFDFKNPVIIQEVKWYQDTSNPQGEATTGSWKFFGSNNNATWTSLSNTFVLGVPATQTITGLSGNNTSYQYYNMSGIGTGFTTSGPYTREIEFKILIPASSTSESTGCLTGQIPFGAVDDYVYLYQPDGTSVYNPNSLKFNVISEPQIYSISPSTVNQYQYFTPVFNGKNFKYFTNNLPCFYSFDGGVNNDTHTGKNIMSNSGGAADTAYVANLMITGATGIYNATIRNTAGSVTFTGALLVSSGINQARFGIGCNATLGNPSWRVGSPTKNTAPSAIDGSLETFAAISCTPANAAHYISIIPKNNNVMNVSLIRVLMSGLPVTEGLNPHESGSVALYQKGNVTPVFSNAYTSLSGITMNTLNAPYTGVREVRILTPSGGNPVTRYFGLSEVQIY